MRSTELYSGSPTPVNSRAANFYPVPWGEPALGSVGRKRVYSEGQADVKRNLGLRALKLSLRAPGFRREESAFQWMGKSRSLAALVMTNL